MPFASIGSFFANLFDTSDFPARWYCGRWSDALGWLHIISDTAIFGAYLAIPCVISYFILRRKNSPFPTVLWLFVAFIMACGVGHLLEAMIFWYPMYRLTGLVKAITAIVSWVTVIALIRIVPEVLRYPDAMKTAKTLEKEVQERARVEEELRHSLAEVNRLLLVTNKTRHGIMISDPAGRLVWVNEAFTRITGFTKEDAFGVKPGTLLHGPETDAETVDRLRTAIARKERVSEEIISYRKDGDKYWVSLEVDPVFDETGSLVNFIGTQVEITDRKAAEAAIRRSNAQFECLLRADIIGIMTCHCSGPVLQANDEFLRMVGYTHQDLQDGLVNWRTMTPPEWRANDAEVEQFLTVQLSAEPFEKEYLRKDGTRIPVLVGATVLDIRERIYLCFVLDITKQKRSEAALLEAKHAADAANLAKSRFLANMSHEIRTPLTAILGFTDLLCVGQGTPEEWADSLHSIQSSGRHLLTLINDILDLSKIEAGQMEFRRERCSPHRIICDVLSVLRVRTAEKNIRLEFSWKGDVPETVVTDPNRLRQILMNVVGNAVKFTERGGVRVMAEISRDEADPKLLVVVSDTGIGIEAEAFSRIFEPFHQADSSITRKFGGTGLGLTISRHIAEVLGGTVEATSEPGVGSTFTISVAAGSLENVNWLSGEQSELLLRKQRTVGKALSSLAGYRILVVEDGETNRKLIRRMLVRQGAEVECVANGQLGVNAAIAGQFDAILMDMQMPVMDGFTATRQLRAAGFDLPIVALTAHAMRGDIEKCLQAGCSTYLPKPIDMDELTETLRELVTAAGHMDDHRPVQKTPAMLDKVEPIWSTLMSDDQELLEIIGEFIERCRERVVELVAAFEANDRDRIREIAHWLKGAGGTVGFDCLTEAAGQLESALRNNDASQIGHQLDVLAELADRLSTSDRTQV